MDSGCETFSDGRGESLTDAEAHFLTGGDFEDTPCGLVLEQGRAAVYAIATRNVRAGFVSSTQVRILDKRVFLSRN